MHSCINTIVLSSFVCDLFRVLFIYGVDLPTLIHISADSNVSANVFLTRQSINHDGLLPCHLHWMYPVVYNAAGLKGI